MWAVRLLLLLVIVMVIIGFSIYNSAEKVQVNLVTARYVDVPMIFVAYWAFVIGMFVSFVLGVSYYLRATNQLRDAEKEKKKVLAELTALRNRPIDETEEV